MDRSRQIRLFFGNQLPLAERDELLAWMETPEGKRYLHSQINELWDQTNDCKGEEWDAKTQYSKMLAEKEIHFLPTNTGRKTSLWNTLLRYGVAAVLLALLVVPAIWMATFQKASEEFTAPPREETWITRVNPAGQKSKLSLPDGSTVYLNASSSIRFARDFKVNRSLFLDGEAFFDVAEDPVHPFRVQAGGTVTEALGTSFNIRASDSHDNAEVTLLTGKVAVADLDTRSSLKLLPGEAANYKGETGELTSRKVDADKVVEWINGVLRFENQSFETVIHQLENWYGVKIHWKGNLPKDKISGVFQNGESLENVLISVSHTVPFRFEMEDKNVHLDFKPN